MCSGSTSTEICQLLPHTTLWELGISRGDLVFPVSNLPQPQLPTADADSGESFRVFLLFCSDQPEISRIPLSSSIDPDVLPEKRLGEGFSLSTTKGDDFVSVKAGHNLIVGDYLVIRSKNYKIKDIHPDDCFARVEGSCNILYVNEPFANNVKRQIFRYPKMIWVFGQLVDVPAMKIQKYRPVEISFKANKN